MITRPLDAMSMRSTGMSGRLPLTSVQVAFAAPEASMPPVTVTFHR